MQKLDIYIFKMENQYIDFILQDLSGELYECESWTCSTKFKFESFKRNMERKKKQKISSVIMKFTSLKVMYLIREDEEERRSPILREQLWIRKSGYKTLTSLGNFVLVNNF